MLHPSPCRLAVLLVPSTLLCGVAGAATFEPIAREFTNGLTLLNPDVPVALAEDGKVAFFGTASAGGPSELFVYDAGSLGKRGIGADGFRELTALQINAAGNVAFAGVRETGPVDSSGVYRTTVALGAPTTVREDLLDTSLRTRYLALADNNTVAYSSITNGGGALYRHDLLAAPAVLRSGSGTYFNNQQLDVNDAGQVPVQMEHTRAFGGLGRGILVFETPGQTIPPTPASSVKTAFEQAGVGVQPTLSINNDGTIAFALNSATMLSFYDPANNPSGTLIDSVELQPGVYTVDPTLYGTPRTYTQIADAAGAFASFGRVQINDSGAVVFEAALDGGAGSGLFAGGDPVADRLVLTGQPLGSTPLISFVKLGELNNAGQFTFLTSDFVSTDRQVWIGQLPEPASLIAWGSVGILVRRRRRGHAR